MIFVIVGCCMLYKRCKHRLSLKKSFQRRQTVGEEAGTYLRKKTEKVDLSTDEANRVDMPPPPGAYPPPGVYQQPPQYYQQPMSYDPNMPPPQYVAEPTPVVYIVDQQQPVYNYGMEQPPPVGMDF